MDSIGAEVGQKMRSAIKAKLMELGCYVDDELPDYIMVMVANKRTKAQMEDDLQLFLRSDTEIFVEWLQQVLKKLKEVQITNPEVCSSFKELKRKATMEIVEVAIKKEKKGNKTEKKSSRVVTIESEIQGKSLTDDIPVQAKKLVEKRILQQKAETSAARNVSIVHEDDFDIPSLAEMNNLEELTEESRKVMMKSDSDDDDDFINIRADTEDLLGNEVAPPIVDKLSKTTLSPTVSANTQNAVNRNLRKLKINQTKPQKPPMSERLGVRVNSENVEDKNKNIENTERSHTPERIKSKKTRISLTETLREEKELFGRIRNTIQSIIKKPEPNRTDNNSKSRRSESNHKSKVQKNRVSVHKRLGLPSSVVSLPPKKKDAPKEDEEVEKQKKSVMSVVQVKPRRTLAGKCQANKNLLLKAVAEAQKSVTQAVPVVPKPNQNKNALFTKKYREKHGVDNKKELNKRTKKGKDIVDKKETKANLSDIRIELNRRTKKSLEREENDVKEISENCIKHKEDALDEMEESNCVPAALDLNYDEELLEDIDESVQEEDENDEKKITLNQQFIVTLDGLKDKNFIKKVEESKDDILDLIVEDVQLPKRPPSPIIFDKPEPLKKIEKVSTLPPIPDVLPKVTLPASITSKSKEKCKYWPNCRLKDACEFLHPTACKMFPMCKFGDRCLYIHPKCKFYSSCTRKDCPYSHGAVAKMASKIVARPAQQETCKYFPNCSNNHCLFYHPKPCRFGKYCLNKSECNFSHGSIPTKEKLTWHSNAR